MNEIINGKNLDSILEYCLEIYKTDNGYIFSHDLKSKLFPDLTLDEVELLYEYLNDFRPKVLDVEIEGNPCLVKNGITERFFKNGGFTKIESELNSESDLSKTKENLDLEIKHLQKDKFVYEQKIRVQNDRIRNLTEDLKFISLIQKYWWFIGACIGLGWLLGEILGKIGLTS
ncbi:hypothetical protein [Maribacter sp. 4G9]|uniref:hypothetical protein n=1 Tax=Maribacter sp. 4G9 TaxID=1889777 RepID=UPI000C161B01|nr:hypothetical protein [Maribacter sp. 4G9]PIB31281.1 hypothetical protein BFP75_20915 [Maribacter sp. 4G9]